MPVITLPMMGGGGEGIQKVPDAAGRLAIAATKGDFVIQLDNNTLYEYDGTQWIVYASPTSPQSVGDTDSVNLTLASNVITADLRISNNAADSANVRVDNNIESTSSVGLRSQVSVVNLKTALDPEYVLKAGDTMTGDLFLNANPTSDLQAATKQYVDSLFAGLHWKQNARVATTAPGTLASSFENGDTVDGVVLSTGDRILIKNQVSASENGIYIVAASGAPSRSTDADTYQELNGAAIAIAEGTANGNKGFIQTTELTSFAGQVWIQAFGNGMDHSALSNLAADDHLQYLLLAGRGTGQTAYGGTNAGNNLTLSSTNNGTKGKILLGSAGTSAFDEANGRLGIGTASPTGTVQWASGQSLAPDGTFSAPSYSFANSTDIGMYLVSTSRVGLGAGGSIIWDINYNSGNPITTFYGTATALGSEQLRLTDIATFTHFGSFYQSNSLGGMAIQAWDVASGLNVDRNLFLSPEGGKVSVGGYSPTEKFHVFNNGAIYSIYGETQDNTNVASAGIKRARASNANLQNADVIGNFDFVARFNSSNGAVARVQAIYQGNGTTQTADLLFLTSSAGAVAERFRIRQTDALLSVDLKKANNTTNASFVGSGMTPESSGATASNGQSASATFSTDTIMFTVTVGTDRRSILCHTDYAASTITAISDPGNLLLTSDSGTGIYISKSGSSGVITVKNRMGGSRVIVVQAVNSVLSSVSAWA